MQDIYGIYEFYLQSSSASAAICASFSVLTADLMVTVVSVNVRFLLPSNIFSMVLTAVGAHEPFSMRPIVLFL